jgi:hypothetical protein
VLAASGDVSNAASGAMTLASTATAQILGNLTNDGTLSSAGQLSVSGATTNTGTLNLLAGSSTVLSSLANSGTLDALGSLTVTGAVNNSGSMTLDTGSTPVLGSLVNSGTILANDLLTVAGSFVQNAGTLTAKAGLTTGTLSGTGGSIDLAGSTYNLNQTADATYSGSVTGGGTVNKYGTGTLTLNGVADSFAASSLNIYAGGVTVATKNLLDSALDVLIDTAGTLTLQADQTIHDLTGTGTLNIGTSTLTLADGGAFDGTINGTGAIGTGAGTLDLSSAINNTGGSFTVGNGSTVNVGATGSITTTALNVTGGTLDLSGTASATTTTLSNGATLHLGNGVDLDETGAEAGTLNSTTTTVNGGSSITGNGYVTGTVNVGGTTAGTIAPGNSPGILTFDTLNLGDNATAAMQVDGTAGAGNAGGNDLIIVKNAEPFGQLGPDGQQVGVERLRSGAGSGCAALQVCRRQDLGPLRFGLAGRQLAECTAQSGHRHADRSGQLYALDLYRCHLHHAQPGGHHQGPHGQRQWRGAAVLRRQSDELCHRRSGRQSLVGGQGLRPLVA